MILYLGDINNTKKEKARLARHARQRTPACKASGPVSQSDTQTPQKSFVKRSETKRNKYLPHFKKANYALFFSQHIASLGKLFLGITCSLTLAGVPLGYRKRISLRDA